MALYRLSRWTNLLEVTHHFATLGTYLCPSVLATYKRKKKISAFQTELMRVGGRSTVACLFINGQPKYESGDLVAYLQQQVRAAS